MEFQNNNIVSNGFTADMNEWDQWMRWDGQPDIVDPSLVQKPVMATKDINLNLGNQQWQNGIVDQSNNTFFEDIDIQDGLFEIDTPSLSPTTTDSSVKSSSSSPVERNVLDFETETRPVSKATTSSQVTSAAPKEAPAKPTRGRGKRRKTAHMNEADLTQSRKRGHNAIEKRYRTNLNEKIIALRESIPSLRSSSVDENEDDDEEAGRDGAPKFGKAAILTRAVEYIAHLEETTKRMGDETNALKARVLAFEKLAMSGTDETKSQSYSLFEPAQTLDSIQTEFLQKKIEKEKEKPTAAPVKRRNSKK